MVTNFLKTGIKEIDDNWGGFRIGYTYLLISEKEAINNEILLKYTYKNLTAGQAVLYFTSLAAENFLNYIQKIIPNTNEYVKKNLLALHFINPEFLKIRDDKKILTALAVLKKILVKEPAKLLIIENFNYFLNFQNLEKLYKEIFEIFQILRESSGIGLFSLIKKFVEENNEVFSYLKEIAAGVIFYENNKYHLFSRFSHGIKQEEKKLISISEFPQDLVDQDEYTGLYNYQGFCRILANLIAQKINFSLFGFSISFDFNEHLKRIFLHRITKVLKENGIKVPGMRYQDKIYLLFLDNKEKLAECKKIINQEEIAGGIKITNFIYHYPEDFQTLEELIKIL
jgi:hypothetical protein|uniref:Uncharacterized protein n=1 Tax=candidate division WOR-3 bacterium TaxID=2052148 RepID=A0A7V5XZW6_UNCW3